MKPEGSENRVEYILGEDDDDVPRPNKNSVCDSCGRGPFRSLKVHLLHCPGVKAKYQCLLCKENFMTEKLLHEHHMYLYSCKVCGQVFSNESMYRQHPCPQNGNTHLVLFCSEAMPQVCNICKCFFTSKETLLNHVNRIHTSVVSTKVCIITNPSALVDKKVLAATQVTSVNSFKQVLNGKPQDGQACLSPPPFLTPSVLPGSALAPNNSAQTHPPSALQSEAALSTTSSDPDSPQTPSILAMFANDSQSVALMKRMNTAWRAKAPHPCRQCGAIFRQPSLVVTHRYLHRGSRLHRCQCGRAFKHRLHLLRHCVQHAENMSYICVGCGETFIGATALAKHIKEKSRKKCHHGLKHKSKVKKKCSVPFTCECGLSFFRPSAYIWHQLKNRTEMKPLKKSLK